MDRCWLLLLLCLSSGCGLMRAATPTRNLAPVENPLFVAVEDREYFWNQLVDAIDDHFQIVQEDRVQAIGGILTEGRVETAYKVGSTFLEPWRSDSSPGYQRALASLQTIRRRAIARVYPTAGGFLVELTVEQELEDLNRPEFSTVGQSSERHDGTEVRIDKLEKQNTTTLGWIPLERECELEKRILSSLRDRLAHSGNLGMGPRPDGMKTMRTLDGLRRGDGSPAADPEEVAPPDAGEFRETPE
jgi:hypothetical protein